jgi:hypothetical protein
MRAEMSSAAPAARAAPTVAATTRLRVLLIDDDAELAGLLAELLAREGFELSHGAGAATGLALPAKEDRTAQPPLEVSLTRDGPGWAALAVRDHGPGIPAAADRARLVLPFQRGEQGRRTPGTGLGLGLAIVARMADRRGGRLLLEDAMPGLRAVLRLPVST